MADKAEPLENTGVDKGLVAMFLKISTAIFILDNRNLRA